jgi:hypothetical protein
MPRADGDHPVSEANLRRVRDYAVEEPGFTVAFAAWDLSRQRPHIAIETVRRAVAILLGKGVIRLVEDAGRFGKVYAYAPPTGDGIPTWQPGQKRHLFAELDDARIGELAPTRGGVVAHTRIRGSTGRPGEDKRRQARGVRMTRGKGK